jgi:hypothetical protein
MGTLTVGSTFARIGQARDVDVMDGDTAADIHGKITGR